MYVIRLTKNIEHAFDVDNYIVIINKSLIVFVYQELNSDNQINQPIVSHISQLALVFSNRSKEDYNILP